MTPATQALPSRADIRAARSMQSLPSWKPKPKVSRSVLSRSLFGLIRKARLCSLSCRNVLVELPPIFKICQKSMTINCERSTHKTTWYTMPLRSHQMPTIVPPANRNQCTCHLRGCSRPAEKKCHMRRLSELDRKRILWVTFSETPEVDDGGSPPVSNICLHRILRDILCRTSAVPLIPVECLFLRIETVQTPLSKRLHALSRLSA